MILAANNLNSPLNKSDIFIKGNTNAKLFQYSISRQKKIMEPFVKYIFKIVIFKKFVIPNKIVTPKEILNNT